MENLARFRKNVDIWIAIRSLTISGTVQDSLVCLSDNRETTIFRTYDDINSCNFANCFRSCLTGILCACRQCLRSRTQRRTGSRSERKLAPSWEPAHRRSDAATRKLSSPISNVARNNFELINERQATRSPSCCLCQCDFVTMSINN